VLRRSSRRRSTRSTAAASQLRSGEPATTAMAITIQTRAAEIARIVTIVIATDLLVIQPPIIARANESVNRHNTIPRANVCCRKRSHFQRNSARLRLVSTVVNRNCILSLYFFCFGQKGLQQQRCYASENHPPPGALLQDGCLADVGR